MKIMTITTIDDEIHGDIGQDSQQYLTPTEVRSLREQGVYVRHLGPCLNPQCARHDLYQVLGTWREIVEEHTL